MRSLVLVLCLVLSLPAMADRLLVAAGAGYKKPLTEIYAAFTEETGIGVDAAFGNMQQVLAQTRDSGRVDLVVGEQGFLRKSGLFNRFEPLGTGRLVLAYGRQRLDSWQDIADPSIERIALPDPKKAIYGRAATQFLERSGLMPQVKERLMTLATVPQVSAYLLAGTVDVGFINVTDALGIAEKIAGFDELPADLYDPPRIVLAFPTSAGQTDAAEALATFVSSDQARAIFKRFGL
ncbi:molybdate ABC transporter substrate-binding protein [Thiorhodovibrio frisius]|uniref:Molybdenum ABC transporter, periplasmic molybdate-binding protein n=1 Tax=Thiorhodovibrio frisius TaxID=631362 RepID=H8Z610_9GAMM|nr:molybdate ABC transporter substrate-binding protein [Thiorhodovibrio frisius]EIC20660.1 molybdenum ABC transporter, periplasmic molybdate-binding protein [Thiorhodovibrio frisius]WPL21408.1 Putative binding protein precursor [Thiorhodovibrio frisius]